MPSRPGMAALGMGSGEASSSSRVGTGRPLCKL
jgi:hypothetical protein